MVAHNLTVMAAAMILDAVLGDPGWLYRRVPHPVVWMGRLLGLMDRHFNRNSHGNFGRLLAGAACLLFLLAISGGIAWALDHLLAQFTAGWLVTALLASTLLAQRSLFQHVRAVARPLAMDDIVAARAALALIVGRDVQTLDTAAIGSAAIESLAENLSDGVIAPLFWGCVAGFPGLVLYKAINTADSMIGHRTARFLYFGRAAARLDDLANLIPARLTGICIAVVCCSRKSLRVMLADAGAHRSPNAGWPEAAMAGALDVRLSGPRAYHGAWQDEPFINAPGSLPDAEKLNRALGIMVRACGIALAITLAVALYFNLSERPATTSSTSLAIAATA